MKHEEAEEQPTRGQFWFFFICALIGTAIAFLPGIRIG